MDVTASWFRHVMISANGRNEYGCLETQMESESVNQKTHINDKKNTRSPARGEQVPSDLSLGSSLITITGDTEDVNTKISSTKKIPVPLQ